MVVFPLVLRVIGVVVVAWFQFAVVVIVVVVVTWFQFAVVPHQATVMRLSHSQR